MHLSGCWFWIACCRAGSTQGHCKANRKGNTLFFNQDFLHWAVRHHCLNNRCPHLQPWWWGWRSGGSSRPGCLPHRKVGKEDCSHGWALLSSLWDAEGMPEGSRNVCTDICSCTPPPPPTPKCCVLSREENEKDHSLFGKILSVLLSWAAVIGVLRDSCCRCQARWTCYLRCLALGESSPQAPWESAWIRGLHPDDQWKHGAAALEGLLVWQQRVPLAQDTFYEREHVVCRYK